MMFKLFIVLLLSMGLSHAASNGNFQRSCKAYADMTVEMYTDVKSGAIVNAMPQLKDYLDKAKAHKGTEKELWMQIYNECTGIKT